MSLRFYMDHHIPSAVTEGLRRRGIDVLTAFEDGHHEATDEILLARATLLSRILYTHDDDLLDITHQWLKVGQEFAGLVYSPQLGITIGQAIRDLEMIALASSLRGNAK